MCSNWQAPTSGLIRLCADTWDLGTWLLIPLLRSLKARTQDGTVATSCEAAVRGCGWLGTCQASHYSTRNRTDTG